MIKRIIILAMSLAAFAVPQAATIPDGAYGVWQVPSIETNSPVYAGTVQNGQAIIDEENSALILDYGKGKAILDHAYSEVAGGTWDVSEMKVGEPGFLITEDGTYIYQCVGICLAKQSSNKYHFAGVTIYPEKDDIVCISCAEDDGWVYLAYYKFQSKL